MVQRELYMEKLRRLKDKDVIKVITGVRRCGKSYLLQLFIDELIDSGISEENIILINFDSIKYKNIRRQDELDELVLDLINNIQGHMYLFFDEIQNVKFWEKSIVSYYTDLDCDIYITGSNSNLLSYGKDHSHFHYPFPARIDLIIFKIFSIQYFIMI